MFTPVYYPHVAARLPAVGLKASLTNSIRAQRTGLHHRCLMSSAACQPSCWMQRLCLQPVSILCCRHQKRGFGGGEVSFSGAGCCSNSDGVKPSAGEAMGLLSACFTSTLLPAHKCPDLQSVLSRILVMVWFCLVLFHFNVENSSL